LLAPYCYDANICCDDDNLVPIKVLRDTAALQSLLLASAVPTSSYSHTGEVRLLKGISSQPLEVPLVELHLQTTFLDEKVLCGLIKELSEGINFLLGNDIWFQAHPLPGDVAVVTRAQAAKQTIQSTGSPQEMSNNGQTDSIDTVNPPDMVHYGDLDLIAVKTSEDFQKLQTQDKGLSALQALVEQEPFPVSRSFYFMSEGMLMHHSVGSKHQPEADQLVVPTLLRNKVLFLAHDIPAAGHLGMAKTQARIWPHLYWPHMTKEVRDYCKSCDMCQRLGKGQKPAPAPLIPLPLITEPFTCIAIDIVGPLPVTKSGNRFILTVMDLATHYPEATPLKDHTTRTVAQALCGVFSHFGFPEEILSDQGSDFMSELMQIFLHDFKITQLKASAYHPQTNGSCERFHRTLKSMFRANTDKFPDSWDECLPWVMFAYREIPVETLGFSPFEMLFGRNIRGPLHLLKSGWKPTSIKTKPNVIEYLLQVRERLKSCQEIADKTATQARAKAKLWYDRKARQRSYEPGQLVLVCLPVQGRPLDAKYCGPYRVLERVGPVDYIIATPD